MLKKVDAMVNTLNFNVEVMVDLFTIATYLP
jgi:hypothetical protein